MRIRVRGTLTRVRPKVRVSSPSHGSRCIRLLPLLSVFIIITALGILALSEMSMVGKEQAPGVLGGGGAASRIMPGRAHSRTPQHHKTTHQPQEKGMSFKMEPLLRRDALSVELTAQMVVNRFRGAVIAGIIDRESLRPKPPVCSPPLPDCSSIPPNLFGKVDVDKWLKDSKIDETRTLPGGPKDCSPRHAVAIIIPYRDREKQLATLLNYLPPILERQQLSYRIFVVEQVGNDTFNKGVLMNAGALTALDYPLIPGVMYHCLIFHDVDMLPEDDRILYSCPQQPRHLSVAVNELDYKLPYRQLVGGVFAIRTDHFLRVNGYSNLYWGWGGEDDDMGYRYLATGVLDDCILNQSCMFYSFSNCKDCFQRNRNVLQIKYIFALKEKTRKQAEVDSREVWDFPNCVGSIDGKVEHVLSWISRPPEWIARYTMIKHEKRKPLARKVRTKLLRTSWRRYRLDGLNTAAYGLLSVKPKKPGYIHILIDVGHPPNSIRQLQQEEESNQETTT